MREAFYQQTAGVEGRHWWFRHRRRLLDGLLRGRRADDGLDVGCGTGGNLELLGRHCTHLTALDCSPVALDLARRHGRATLVRGDANRLRGIFRPGSFDLLTLLNVLYHRWVEQPDDVVSQAAGLLRAGGRLLITEPAFPALFRRHDVVDFGARRFRLSELTAMARAAGLAVRRATYFNALSLPAAWALARMESSQHRSADEAGPLGELWLPPAWLNGALLGLCAVERGWIAAGARLPAGVGLLLLAEKEPNGQVLM